MKGAPLGYATRVVQKHAADVGDAAHKLVRESEQALRAAEERERAQLQRQLDAERQRAAAEALAAQRLRRGAALLGVMLLAALVAGGLAIHSSREASRQAAHAEAALSRQLTEEGRRLILDATPDRALVYLSTAYNRDLHPSIALRYLVAASETLSRSLRLSSHGTRFQSVVFSPDDTQVLAAGSDGTVHTWNTASGVLDFSALIEQPEQISLSTGSGGPAVFSPDGRYIGGCGSGSRLLVWEKSRRAPILQARCNQSLASEFAPDGKRILVWQYPAVGIVELSGGQQLFALNLPSEPPSPVRRSDTKVRREKAPGEPMWAALQASKGEETPLAPPHRDLSRNFIAAAAYSKDGTRIFALDKEGAITSWDARDGTLRDTLPGLNTLVYSPRILGGTSQVQALSENSQHIRIVDARDGKPIGTIPPNSGVLRAVWRDGNQARFLTAFGENKPTLWSVELTTNGEDATLQHQRPKTLEAGPGKLTAAAFSQDGRRLVTVTAGRHLAVVWDGETGTVLQLLKGHEGEVAAVAVNRSGTQIATASVDGTVRLWSAASSRTRTILRQVGVRPRYGMHSAIFSPDGTRVLGENTDHGIMLWNATTGEYIDQIEKDEHFWVPSGQGFGLGSGRAAPLPPLALQPPMSFSADGTQLISRFVHGEVHLSGEVSGALAKTSENATEGARTIQAAFTAHGPRKVVATPSGAGLWDVATGRLLTELQSSPDADFALLSPDGTRVAVWVPKQAATVLYDAGSGRPIAALQGHEGRCAAVAFSPDSKRLVTAGDDTNVLLWSAVDGKRLALLGGHAGVITAAIFDPSGRLLLTASADQTGRIWNGQDGRLLTLLEVHGGSLHGVAFSPDGEMVASASEDGLVRIFEGESGRLLEALEGHAGSVSSVAFSPDGERLVSAGHDGTGRIWDVHLETRPAAAIAHLAACRFPMELKREQLVPRNEPVKGCGSPLKTEK